MENPAGFDDARVDDIVVGVESVAPYRHQLGVAKQRQVLGDVCFGDAKLLYQ